MRLTIKTTLIGIIGVLAIAIAGQGLFAASRLRTVNANATDIATSWLPSVRWIGELRYATTQLRVVDARYVIAYESMLDLDTAGAARLAAVVESAKKYEPFITGPEERALWDRFKGSGPRISTNGPSSSRPHAPATRGSRPKRSIGRGPCSMARSTCSIRTPS